MRSDDCFKKRLLRRDRPDMNKAIKSIEIAFEKLNRSYALFEDEFFEEALVKTYTSMFHAARAIFFKDGIIEKSHVCVVAYLGDNYSSELGKDKISWLDTYRLERHESFYGLDELSMNAPAIPAVKNAVRDLTLEKAKKAAAEALHSSSAGAVRKIAGDCASGISEFSEID